MNQPARMTAPGASGDDELMARVQAGRVDAFEQLYDRYSDRAYNVALAVCRDDGRARDAVQEAFVSIWRSRATGSQAGPVAARLLTAVRRQALDVERENGRHVARQTTDSEADARTSPDPVAERDEARLLPSALAQLSDAQREVITLAFYGQLTHTEIAQQLGLLPGIVKDRMRHGLHLVRDGLKRDS